MGIMTRMHLVNLLYDLQYEVENLLSNEAVREHSDDWLKFKMVSLLVRVLADKSIAVDIKRLIELGDDNVHTER